MEIKLVQIILSNDHLYGLDKDGNVWYRKKLPAPPYNYNNTYKGGPKEDDENENLLWRPLKMEALPASTEITKTLTE